LKDKLKYILFSTIVFYCFTAYSQGFKQLDSKELFWVDSVYNSLKPQQRIGQLFMLRANSDIDSAEIKELARLIKEYNIGGLCFFKGGPIRQAILTNYYQKLAATPLLISMDAEWGLEMRLDSTTSFARQMTLGAMKNESLISEYGQTIGSQLRRMGVHVTFSPVADLNSNPANPVINIRSFGEHKDDVARKAILYMKALQSKGVITVAKHFPGHGDTDLDSHLSLPVISHSAAIIDSLDLYPFKELIKAGVDGMMVAHLNIPTLDTTKNLPSSLSGLVIDSLLRKKLGFDGLVFTDALDMKGVSNFDKPGMAELKALEAGNDVLLLSVSVDKAVLAIQQAIDSGFYSIDDLENHCKRILSCKYRSGLNKPQPVSSFNLFSDLHSMHDDNLNIELYRNAVTVLKNENNILPISNLDTLKIATLMIGYEGLKKFQFRIDDFAEADHFTLPRNADGKAISDIYNNLKSYNLVIIGINNTNPSPARNFGISDVTVGLVDSLLVSKHCILNLFAIPYSINLFKKIEKANALVIGYQDNEFAYDAVAQMLFGASSATGRLPVGVSTSFPTHAGSDTKSTNRLHYNPHENMRLNETDF
jgi:beta-glucosidase-like glycosyl hydrolase